MARKPAKQSGSRKEKGTTKASKPKNSSKPPPWPTRVLRFLLSVVLLLLVLSIVEVLAVRVATPPATPLMGIRWLQAKFQDKDPDPIQYEWLPLSQVPDHVVRQIWVSEDGRFFRHYGFDLVEMKKVLDQAMKEGKAPRGASTITMQCARSLFLWQDRSFLRKGLEAYYTVLMEMFLPKRRILELYINVIEMGPGVYGIQAAAQHHFNKPAHRLTQEESAAIVAILPNPLEWNPVQPTDRVKNRQSIILERSRKVDYPVNYLKGN